ncbi:TerC family protein [Paenibacillus medicaginis]|uniref:TerC family protein n=1 Tax=Paenibacillus medicaginis TaxID=1470560 RepID=A0ABV5BVW4_9BACL
MEHIWLLMQILMVNLVLSGDNAVVIALASKNLPLKQRRQAIWWGSFGAVLLRCVLTFGAVLLLGIPFIQGAGGLLLLWIAFKLLFDNGEGNGSKEAATVGKAVQIILAADLVMSLDNVLAIAALAEGDLAIMVIGIVLSIPIVVWGSTLIAALLQRFPVLILAGSAILAFTAGEMMMNDPLLRGILDVFSYKTHPLLPAALCGGVIAAGIWHMSRPRSGREW